MSLFIDAETRAKNCRTHWLGGPDFAVEIVSEDDRTRDKIPFYSESGDSRTIHHRSQSVEC